MKSDVERLVAGWRDPDAYRQSRRTDLTSLLTFQGCSLLVSGSVIAQHLDGDSRWFTLSPVNVCCQNIEGTTFTCNSTIIEIVTNKNRHHKACPACLQTVYEGGDGWAWPCNGKFNTPKYM